MNEQTPPKEETLAIIKEIETNPAVTQRKVSAKLGISLGKTNYLLRELVKKGIIKGENFSNNPGRIKKISYMLTPKGLEEKMSLVRHFLKVKEEEYIKIRQDWESLNRKT